ncbi:MAG: NADP-dependent phosphogluconate dehydrogenase, partial [Chroococcidiopsis sp.]
TQAQRDYFGAHTYERTDKEGFFHTEWTKFSEESLQTSTPEPLQADQPTTPQPTGSR